jgi:hypothetical protein
MKSSALHLLVAIAAASIADPAGSHSTRIARDAARGPLANEAAWVGDCAACHTAALSTSDSDGSIEIRGLPEHYTPGQRYTVTFAIQHSAEDRLRWGFAVTAVTAETHSPAGHLTVNDRQNTQAASSPAGYEFVSHTYPGTAIGRSGGHRWSFDWLAPQDDVGSVIFVGAGLAADADGTERGDLVYVGTFEEPLAVVNGPATESDSVPALSPPRAIE